jgi:hypothetical protein
VVLHTRAVAYHSLAWAPKSLPNLLAATLNSRF